ncbi:MAG: sigma-70 family RNA polymerase sigma factor [Anaerolineae bacterium]|nr:sigma-70 family RNA polymerase sigma factor [Anaerolineae bacterium]
MDEQALLASARAGNLGAFNTLIHTYQDMAYNVAYRVLGQPDAAADATQDAFLAAYRALPAFRGGCFKVWLLRIVTNSCYDQLRLRKRRPQTSLDDMVEDPDYAAALADRGEGPEEVILREELAQALQAGIAKLPADQRVVLVLSDVQGLSYDEIAEATGVTLGTVKSRLSRARARLRDFMTRGRELWAP